MTYRSAIDAFRDSSAASFRLRCWGEFALIDPLGRNRSPKSRKAKALIAFLASRPSTPVPRGRLADLLWTDRGEEQARASLRQCLRELHPLAADTPPLLRVTRTDVMLEGTAFADCEIPTDLESLIAIVAQEDALLFSDLSNVSEGFDEWLTREREARQRDLIVAGLAAAQAGMSNGSLEKARLMIDMLERLDPLDEAIARLGFAADGFDGNRTQIERRQKRLRETLARELGVEPSAETEEAYREALAQVNGAASAPNLFYSNIRSSLKPTLAAAFVALLLIASSILLYQRLSGNSNAEPSVGVAGAQNEGPSAEMARNLSADLARLAGARVGTFKLIDTASGRVRPDYFVRIDAEGSGAEEAAEVSLLAGRSSQLLWSASFPRGDSPLGELRQQVGAKIADVLSCALEAAGGKVRLSGLTLAAYLRACDLLHEQTLAERNQSQINLLRAVTQREPGFAPVWARLALSEATLTQHIDTKPSEVKLLRDSARRHLTTARRLNPRLGATFAAEAILVAEPRTWAERLRIYERGVAQDPGFAALHALRAGELMTIGRLREAVTSARRAVALDPISPSARWTLINILAYSGRSNAALRELAEAERLWPGSSSVTDARHRFNLRYGDPSAALQMERLDSSLAGPSWEAYLGARIDPRPANVDAAFRSLAEMHTRVPRDRLGGWLQIYLQALGHFDRVEEAFALLTREAAVVPEMATDTSILFRPHLRSIRNDPRFMSLASKIGLLAFWAESGLWPDFCFDPRLPYDCRVEAKKYV